MGHINQIKELLKKEKETLCLRELHNCLFCQDCELESHNHLSGAPEFLNPETTRKGLSQPEAENVHGMNSELSANPNRHG